MSKNAFEYTGVENLDAMAGAKHYNDYLVSLITDHISDIRKAKVLDFGAGSGTYADLLKSKGIVVDCLEPDAALKKTLKAKGYAVADDIAKLKPGSYDVIYALNVLEHIENDGEALTKLSKALKKNGRLVIYVPAFQVLYTNMDKHVGHFRRYRTERLKRFANDAGMTIKQLHYCDPLGFGAALAYKYIGNKQGTISPGSVRFYDSYIFPVSKLLQPVFKHVAGKNVVLVAEK